MNVDTLTYDCKGGEWKVFVPKLKVSHMMEGGSGLKEDGVKAEIKEQSTIEEQMLGCHRCGKVFNNAEKALVINLDPTKPTLKHTPHLICMTFSKCYDRVAEQKETETLTIEKAKRMVKAYRTVKMQVVDPTGRVTIKSGRYPVYDEAGNHMWVFGVEEEDITFSVAYDPAQDVTRINLE